MSLLYQVKKFFGDHHVFLLFLIAIFVQHRFWLFDRIYSNPGGQMGSEGDAYYNIAIYMQNLLNLSQGHLYSLDGDHNGFYSNIIGVTAHGFAPSLVFGFLWAIFRNPILVFNLIFFGNLILTQIGIYGLVKHYTKKSWLAFLAGILVVLSQATVGNFYVGHIHASLYWALPFLILFLEKLFTLEKLSKKQFYSYLAGVFITLLWLYLAEWHIAIFSSIWIVIWTLFKLKYFYINFNVFKSRLLGVVVSYLAVLIILFPLALGYLQSSKVYNTTRTIGSVSATNFATGNFYGIKFLLIPAIYTYSSYLAKPESQAGLNDLKNNINRNESNFPDGIFNISFWILNLLLIPWLVIWFKRKGNFFNRELSFCIMFLISAWIGLGPFLKIAERTLQNLPLPHYYLYQMILPLSAIRAIWRATAVGYLAVIVLWSSFLGKFWEYVKDYFLSKNKVNKTLPKFLKIAGYSYIVVLIIAFCLIQNNGFRGNAVSAISGDQFLSEKLSQNNNSKSTRKIFYWTTDLYDGKYNYFVSKHNFERGFRELEWVSGGIAGTYPVDLEILNQMVLQGKYLDQAVSIFSAKKTDYIILDYQASFKDTKSQEVQTQLSKHYTLEDQNEKWQIWKLSNIQNSYSDSNSLKYSLGLSKFQSTGQSWFMILNMENEKNINYTAPNKVAAENYTFEFWQSGRKITEITQAIGGKAVILPKLGYSQDLELKPKLEAGQATLKLVKDKQVLWEGEQEILDQTEYEKKIKSSKTEKLEINSQKTQVPDLFLNLTSIPLNLNLKISSGGIFNYPQKLPIDKNHPVISQYYNASGESYNGFPNWLYQASCELKGNYFKEDNLQFWCLQSLPFDQSYNYSGVKVDAKR